MDVDALSEREREVLDLALEGLTAREIAERLTLTEATIRSHLARIYAKRGVSGRVELLARMKAPATTESSAMPGERSKEEVPEPSSPRRGRRTLLALGLVGVLAVVAAFAMWWLSAPPPETTLTNLSQMFLSGQVQSLEQRNDTLFVTATDGRRYRIEAIDQKVDTGLWAWLQGMNPVMADKVTFTVTKSRDADWLPFLAIALDLAVVAFLAVLALATLRWIVRSTPPARRT